MSFYDYSKFKIRIAPDSGKRQGLEVGDIVRRQYTDGGRTRYSLMAVLETGTDTVEGPDGTSLSSPYFIGALVDGDEPREGELLDFVRLTSLTDPSRSGALYLTGSDGDSPYMDVIDGMAVQRSLCRPEGMGEDGYGYTGAGQVEVSYSESEGSVFRVFTIVKKDIQTGEDIGIRQVLPATLDHPRRVAVSFRAKAGKPMGGVPIRIGYSDGTQSDGAATFDVRPQWDYHLLLVTIDYPPTVERVLQIGLAGHLTDQGDTFSVADLNVVALDELSDYGSATKGRVGRITGIADPLFGVLEGYGAYFQNLYATRNVSVAGTLTAGDGDGFASTFYAGRIHKNVLRNSLNPKFTTGVTEGTSVPPAGIGKTFNMPAGETMLECQNEQWAQAHEGKRYCFSFWAYSEAAQTLSVRYGDKVIGTVEASPSWQRHSLRLRILCEAGQPMQVGLTAPQPWVFTSPQLEAGNHATLYQPTDGVLDETEGYGAWFNKGGIGGTIQNPLLKLEADGSIRSAGGSFVINADGTGYFAGGKLKWDREQIVLEDLTIDWEQVAGHMPKSVTLRASVSSNQPLTQIYGRDTNSNNPNWAISPFLVLTPSLLVSTFGQADQITVVASEGKPGIKPGSVLWYKGSQVVESGKNLATVADAAGKYALTIKANVIPTYSPQLTFTFTAVYMDEHGAENPVQAELQFTKLSAPGATIMAIMQTPDGIVFRGGEPTALRLHCDLWRGNLIDDTNVSYVWGVPDPSVFANTKLATAVSKGATEVKVQSTENMAAGTQIQIITTLYTITAVDHDTRMVSVTPPVAGNYVTNGQVLCPRYNAVLGAGWLALTAENPRGTLSGWGTNELVLSPGAVDGSQTFKCAIRDDDMAKDNPSAGKIAYATASVSDLTVPDISALDWIQDWDTNKTHLGAELVVTPKLFAGEKHDDGLVTGIALGHFPLAMYDDTQGEMAVRQIDGIAGFDHGRKVFSVESTGDVELGFGGQSIRYNAATGQIEFGAGVSMHWIGATYIDPDGIFTGTLSAETVSAVRFNASQITAGTIDAARIDTDTLKTVLLTAGNVEALTLNVRQGTIGGWTIDDTGIYRGTKKDVENTLCDNPSDMTLGGSGIRGRMWRLDAGGAGALAGENIRWDAAGNVFFAPSVSLAWQSGIDAASELAQSVGAELSQHPLTYIGATGIYTGSLTAQQITAGFLLAERFEAGSIKAEKLDADSIKASIVNAAYINGLDCTFGKGTIGGWRIGTTTLSAGHLLLDSANRRMAVYGEGSGPQDGRRVQLYYTDADDFGLLATDGAGSGIVQLGAVNRIAGWNIDTARIYKGSVALGADGSVQNGEKWQLNNDGSGRIAGGNIAWDTAGAVTFSPTVSLNWQNDIQAARTKDYGFAYREDIVVYGDENLYYPVVLKGGEQTIKREIVVRRGYDERAPSSWNPSMPNHHGGLILSIKANFGNWGGINYSWDIYELSELYCRMFAGATNCGNECMFAIFLRGGGTGGALYHMYSDQPLVSSFASPGSIPPSPQVCYDSDLIFNINGTLKNAPAPRTLTAAVNEEIRRHRFIALAQNTDTTLSQHPLTYIGPTGIYTGTLTALQVNAVDIDATSIRTGTLSADRLAAGSIKAEKLDAASLKASVINTDYINGLSCTFSQGRIGGWTIGGDSLWTGTLGLIGSTPVQLRPTSAGSGEWYLGRYKPMGLAVTWHQTGNAGHIVFGQVASAGNAPKTGYIGIQMMDWDNTEYFCLSANYTRSGSKEIYNRIAGWAFDSARIWKNGVSLGSDGSIQNSAKWQLNSDGSGRVASGNIAWDAAGNVSFGASVSLQWRRGQLYVRGTDVNHNATRIVRVNGTDILNGFGRGFFLTVLNRSDLSTVSNTQYDVYANEVTCNNLAAAMNALASDKIVILTSCDAITVNAALQSAIERCGGNSWTGTGRFPFAFIGIPGIGKGNGLMAMYGDTASDPYAEIVTQVIDGVPVGVNLGAKRFTHIDGNGIYTGTVSAGQIHVDTDLVVGGSSYNGSISVRDAANNVKVTLNRAGITAVGGTIGGWSLNATQIYSGTVVLSKDGTIGNGNRWKLGADGSGYLANNNFAWNESGSIYARGCMLEDVTVAGTLRNHFVKHGSTVTFPGASPVQASPHTHDNIIIVQGAQPQAVSLPWTSDQSGRRLCLVNYLWSGTVTQGDVAITAPSGYWFYENGIGQQTLRISRELVELIGYGSDTTFNGWIVVNRRAVMGSSYQGMDQQILAQGAVTCSKATSRGVSMYYKTFDGKQLQVAHTKQGYFTVYLPWTIPAEQYMVMLTGKTSAVQNTSIYASVRDQYSTYFTVSTQDDDSANDGSFNFQIISTAGFSVYSQL